MAKSYLLSAILPLISVTLCITFFFLWYRRRESAHVLDWSAAFACATVGSLADFARALVENAALLSFVANIFLSAVAFFAVRGTMVRYSGKANDRLVIAVYAAMVTSGIWFCFVQPSIPGRGIAISIGAALMFVMARQAIRQDPKIDMIDRLIAWTYTLSTAMIFGRLALSFIYEGPLQAEAEVADSFWIVSFKVFAILSWLSFAILFLLRITTDLMAELATQSLTDPLTGVSNRRGFFVAAQELLRAANPALSATLLIFDIDHFKRVNDTYGHQVGDTVIQGLTDVLRRAAADSAYACGRLGGEEFVVLLPAMNIAGARIFAEGIRIAFAARSYAGIPSSHAITVSIGIVERCQRESAHSLIEHADAALYKAKRAGRNRVEIAAPMQHIAATEKTGMAFSGAASLSQNG